MWLTIIIVGSLAMFAACYIIYKAGDDDLWY